MWFEYLCHFANSNFSNLDKYESIACQVLPRNLYFYDKLKVYGGTFSQINKTVMIMFISSSRGLKASYEFLKF